VGAVGYWEKQWRDESVYEMGWSIVTPYQGRGYATAAAGAAVDSARAEHKHRYIHAFPSVTNPGSNSVCRRLGFELLGECDFEFPIGNMMRCNDWRLDLHPR
jgi:RimJ/RimL family protein N-acetyltransferase